MRCTNDTKEYMSMKRYMEGSSMSGFPNLTAKAVWESRRAQVRRVVRRKGLKRSWVTPETWVRRERRMNWKPKAYMARRGWVDMMSMGESPTARRKIRAWMKYQEMWDNKYFS